MIKTDDEKTKKYDHRSAYLISGYFSLLVYIFCYKKEKDIYGLIDNDFKWKYMTSDCCYLMNEMEGDFYLPIDWRTAIYCLFPGSNGKNVDRLLFSQLDILKLYCFFAEYNCARFKKDYGPIIFFVRSMLVQKGVNLLGLEIFDEAITLYNKNPSSELFQQFCYDRDFDYRKELVHFNYMILNEEYQFLKNNLKQFNISPSIPSFPNSQ